MSEVIAQVDPWDVKPLHEVRDEIKLSRIAMDMSRNGWNGRPLPVLSYEDGYQALAGSHRIEAARMTQHDIPVVTVDGAKFEEAMRIAMEMPEHYDLDDILHQVQLTTFGTMAIAQTALEYGAKEFADLMLKEHKIWPGTIKKRKSMK